MSTFISVAMLFWICLMVLLPYCCGSNINLVSEGKLVKTLLPYSRRTQILFDQSILQKNKFLVPQCHARQYNFTFTQTTLDLDIVKETDSSIGNVVLSGSPPVVTVINKSQNSSISAYCTYTTNELSGIYISAYCA